MAKYTIGTDDRETAIALIHLVNLLEGLDDDDVLRVDHLLAAAWVLNAVTGVDASCTMGDKKVADHWRYLKNWCVAVVKKIDEMKLKSPEP